MSASELISRKDTAKFTEATMLPRLTSRLLVVATYPLHVYKDEHGNILGGVQPNMSNHQTGRQDNSKGETVYHQRLGISIHGVCQGVHVGTLVHAMHHADAVHLGARPAECCQKVFESNGTAVIISTNDSGT